MFARLKTYLQALHDDQRGAMSVEKILILAAVALPILLVLYAFRTRIVTWFNGQADQLQ